MADTKFRERKILENNSNKFFEQGTTHVNVVWQYPTQLQNRVQGPLQQHVTPNHKEKKKILNKFSANIEKNPQNVGKKMSELFAVLTKFTSLCVRGSKTKTVSV